MDVSASVISPWKIPLQFSPAHKCHFQSTTTGHAIPLNGIAKEHQLRLLVQKLLLQTRTPDALLVNQPIAWLIVNKVIQSITPSNSYEAARIAMGCSLTSSSCTSCSLAASLITSRLSWRVLSATCSFNFSTVSRNSSRPTAECNPHHSKCLVIQSKYSWTHVQVFNVSFSHWKPTETGH